MSGESFEPRCAVVLAGRRGTDDPLADADGAPHRALLDIEGEPMLLRVVRCLLARKGLDRVFVNIDAPELLDAYPEWRDLAQQGRVQIILSTDSPSRSVLESLEVARLDEAPVLVTTADHALLDDAMLDEFFAGCAQNPADLSLAMVPRASIVARFPEAKRTYLPFRDESYSGANLFFFRTHKAKQAALFWRRVENDRKKPWRIARAFGLWSLVLFVTKRLDLAGGMRRASLAIGAEVSAIPLTNAEAAVDVDKVEDLLLVRKILSER